MPRKTPTAATIRALLAKSGNQCAFPGCMEELVTHDQLYVGEVCHIKAAEPGGPRYSPDGTDEERRAFENLVLLCHAHHRRIDTDPVTYTAEVLRRMKAEHEAGFLRNQFKVDEAIVYQVEREMEAYREYVREQQAQHPVPDLAVRLNITATGAEVFPQLHERLDWLASVLESLRISDSELPVEISDFLKGIGYDLGALESVPYYENPLENRQWELHNLAGPNILLDLKALVLQAELLYLAEYVKLHSHDRLSRERMDAVKDQLAKIGRSAGYID